MALNLAFCAGGFAQPAIVLEKVNTDIRDSESIMRGAKFFAANCMVCHTMKYLEHDPVAEKAGITLAKMPLKQKEWWMGVVPPDLSLMARQKGPNWLYTYFHSFYKDDTRPTGYNNLVLKNSNMMNIFAALQGVQVLVPVYKTVLSSPHYYSILQLVNAGSMTPEEFSATMTDLVNFLVYASEPTKLQRERLAPYVLGFLIILFIFAYLLKKIYWKDVQ